MFILCATLHEGWGLPLMPQTDPNDPPATHRVRTKRCSCNNQLDSECHYFCHLDIIWVNTPSKTTVYGLGSPLSRRRRSTGRCFCANSADRTCNAFCLYSSENPTIVLVNPSEPVREQEEQPKNESENASPGVLVLGESTSPRAWSDVMTLLRSLGKAKARAMERATHTRQWASRASKPGYRWNPDPVTGEMGERALEQEMTLVQHGLAEQRDAASWKQHAARNGNRAFDFKMERVRWRLVWCGKVLEIPKVEGKLDCFCLLGQHEKGWGVSKDG